MKKELITNNCRTDFESFYDNVLKYSLKDKFKHHPFIVYNEVDNSLNIINSVNDLMNSFGNKPETKVIQQWGGKWSSDFFTFSIGQLQKAIAEEIQ